jgi:hypothetical protein
MYLLLRLVIREYLYLPDHFCEIEQKKVQFHSFFLKFLIVFSKNDKIAMNHLNSVKFSYL